MSEPAEQDLSSSSEGAPRLLLASSNQGKLREFRALSAASPSLSVELDLLPGLSQLPEFIESAPTFGENAAGKALHYSRFTDLPVIADDSGLCVDALGGAPGVQSARYAGLHASSADRIAKLLSELRAANARNRRARFICVLALARRGRAIALFSESVDGEILDAPRGTDGFGYDPVFFFPPLQKSFSELTSAEKNRISHRGKAFAKLLEFLGFAPVL